MFVELSNLLPLSRVSPHQPCLFPALADNINVIKFLFYAAASCLIFQISQKASATWLSFIYVL